MKMKRNCAAAALALATLTAPAQAAVFDLTYDDGSNVFNALIEGTLQGDGNTVIVTGVQDFATVDGVSIGFSIALVESLDEFDGFATGLDPILTLDGTFADIIACSAGCGDGFLVAVGSLVAAADGGDFVASSFGGLDGPFNPQAYSLTEVQPASVPLPAGAVLLASGLGLLALRRRKG